MPTHNELEALRTLLETQLRRENEKPQALLTQFTNLLGLTQNDTLEAIKHFIFFLNPDNTDTAPLTASEITLLKKSEISVPLARWEVETGCQLSHVEKPSRRFFQTSVYATSMFRRNRPLQSLPPQHSPLRVVAQRLRPGPSFHHHLFAAADHDDSAHFMSRSPVMKPTREDSFYSPYLTYRDGFETRRNYTCNETNNVLHNVMLPDNQEEYSSDEVHGAFEQVIEPDTLKQQARMKELDTLLTSTSAEDLFQLLNQSAWLNTPIALGVKLCRWEICEKIIEKAESLLSPEQISIILEQRDAKGLMPLSYALALKAPPNIISFLLDHTSKQAYFTDNTWMEQQHVHYDESAFTVKEDGYYFEDTKMFSLYTLSPTELYTTRLPSAIKVENADKMIVFADQQHFNIYEYDPETKVKSATLFRQIIRNLIFHMRTICISQNIPYQRGKVGVEVNSGIRANFDTMYNYPRIAENRNRPELIDEAICERIDSWMETPLHSPGVVSAIAAASAAV